MICNQLRLAGNSDSWQQIAADHRSHHLHPPQETPAFGLRLLPSKTRGSSSCHPHPRCFQINYVLPGRKHGDPARQNFPKISILCKSCLRPVSPQFVVFLCSDNEAEVVPDEPRSPPWQVHRQYFQRVAKGTGEGD